MFKLMDRIFFLQIYAPIFIGCFILTLATDQMPSALMAIFLLKHYVYSVSNFRPLGLCQETNNWNLVVSYISIVQANQ